MLLGLLIMGCGEEVDEFRFDDLTDDEKAAYMATDVLPTMAALFQEHDSEAYADFSCGTCHVEGQVDGTYAMPDAGLAISIDGKQVGTQLGDMDMMPSGMFMEWVNARLGSFSQGAKRYADPALTAALQGVGKDVSTLVNQLSSPLKSTEMLGLAIDLDSTTLSAQAVIL